MKKSLCGLILFGIITQINAMSDTAQVITATSAAGLINAGTAIYMQGQGMNPQYVTTPYGATTVVPNATSTGTNPVTNAYETQNQQSDKQAFFDGN